MPTALTTLLFILIGLLTWTVPFCSAAEVTLVVHPANPLPAISRQDAEMIFLGKKTGWDSGGAIHVVVNEERMVYDDFCRKILKKTPLQYLLYRKKMLFNGSGIPPLTMADDESVIAFISGSPSAVGFIDSRSLDDRVRALVLRE
ncbi:MAG: hypothetical protein ACOY4H_03475 [Thermodesulfobacteriota bacterium]